VGEYEEALEAYDAGLKIEPANAALQKGKEDAEKELNQAGGVFSLYPLVLSSPHFLSPSLFLFRSSQHRTRKERVEELNQAGDVFSHFFSIHLLSFFFPSFTPFPLFSTLFVPIPPSSPFSFPLLSFLTVLQEICSPIC
jgi:hypothetical protein